MKVEKTCLYCGNRFIADREGRRFCSHSCSARSKGGYMYNKEAGTYEEHENGMQCQYNHAVICYSRNYEKCGWNPEVAQARIDAFLIEKGCLSYA